MAHDVFISYSAKDKATADGVCATLEARGIRCWIAPRDILAGIDWGEAIIEAINASRVMILVFSSNANDSHQIKREVERAVSKGLPIIPLRIENVAPARSLEYFIGPVHWLDALTPPLENHLQSLAETVRLLLARINKEKDGAAESGPQLATPMTDPVEHSAQTRVNPTTAEQPRPAAELERTSTRPTPTAWKTVAIIAAIVGAVGLGAGILRFWPLSLPMVEQGMGPAEKEVPPAAEEAQPAEKETRPSEGYTKSPQDHFDQGTAYLNQGAYDRAITNFTEAIRLDPKYARAYMKRAEAHLLKNEFDRAVADATEAINLDPQLALAYYQRGEAYRLKGDYDKAIADATEAIRLDPKRAWAYFNRGEAFRLKRDYDKAIADATTAIQQDPTYLWAYFNRGEAYRLKNEYDRAITDYSEVIRLSPKHVRAYRGRSMAYENKGERAMAEADVAEANRLESTPSN
jgi:tetratricopeptide (TPR) repeat protein